MSSVLEANNRVRIFKFWSRGKSVNSSRGSGIIRTSECLEAIIEALHFQPQYHCNALRLYTHLTVTVLCLDWNLICLLVCSYMHTVI